MNAPRTAALDKDKQMTNTKQELVVFEHMVTFSSDEVDEILIREAKRRTELLGKCNPLNTLSNGARVRLPGEYDDTSDTTVSFLETA